MGQQHLFYRDLSGWIQHIWWNNGFSGPDVWNQKVKAHQAAGDPAVMTTPHDQHLFYRDHDGWIQHIWWDGEFFGPDQWNKTVGAPAAAGDPAVMSYPGEQHLFYRDADGWIQHIVYDGKLRKADQWNKEGVGVGAPLAVGDPAAMSGEHDQHVFYRDRDGWIQHIWWDGKFFGPDQWNKAVGAPPAAGDPAVMSTRIKISLADDTTGDDSYPKDIFQQHLFYRDHDGLIQHIWSDQGQLHRDIWNTNAPRAKGDPTVMAAQWREITDPVNFGSSEPRRTRDFREQHLFYRDINDQFQHIVWDGKLREPDQWGDGTKALGDPATMYFNDPNEE